MSKILRPICLLLALTLLCSGCGETPTVTLPMSSSAPSAPSPSAVPCEGARRFYQLWVGEYDGRTVMLDDAGNILPEDESRYTLYDPGTNKAVYYCNYRIEDTGEDDEYGNPIAKRWSRLYAMDGTMLLDWAPYNYGGAPGGLVIRKQDRPVAVDFGGVQLPDGYYSALYDPIAQADVLTGVSMLQRADENLYMACDAQGLLLGFINGSGEVVSGFPAPIACYYPSVGRGGCFSTDLSNPFDINNMVEKPLQTLFDYRFNEMLTAEYINLNFYGLRGDYVLVEGANGAQEVRTLPGLETVFVCEKSGAKLQYFDGQRVLLSERGAAGWQYWLVDMQNRRLTKRYQTIEAMLADEFGDRSPAERFIAIDGDTLSILDYDGNATLTQNIPWLNSAKQRGQNRFIYDVTPGDSWEDHAAGLLDENLNIVLSAEKYDYINPLYDGNREVPGLYAAQQSGRDLQDIIDQNGQVVIGDLAHIDAGPDAIAVVRGFSLGLMDYEGNWLVRHSLFPYINMD